MKWVPNPLQTIFITTTYINCITNPRRNRRTWWHLWISGRSFVISKAGSAVNSRSGFIVFRVVVCVCDFFAWNLEFGLDEWVSFEVKLLFLLCLIEIHIENLLTYKLRNKDCQLDCETQKFSWILFSFKFFKNRLNFVISDNSKSPRRHSLKLPRWV